MNFYFLAVSGLCALVTILHLVVLCDMRDAQRPTRDLIPIALCADIAAIATATFFILAFLT